MESRKKKKTKQEIFDSIRKPTAPPTRQIGENQPAEKIHPSRRKTKHKKKDNLEE
ncbi:MAG TPA: hypothetical protein VK892_05930 [Pyrinomonadaceae bacterium]|nr:hypothetical protein [Pyrinomonadaceae bacterium]